MQAKPAPINLESEGAAVPLSMGELDVADVEAYLNAKLNFDSSNHLATIYQRYRQDRQDNGPTA